MAHPANPFDPDQQAAYRQWRAWKLARLAEPAPAAVVELGDPRSLAPAEHAGLLARIARDGVAVYRSPLLQEDPTLPRMLAAQLGLRRLDANWLAEEDGISRIAVSSAQDGAGGFIPYTDRAIGWHTDGYYHPQQRRIRGMVLHCVRPARAGGENALLDPELAYIALRDESAGHVKALMRPDAMTIPARPDAAGVARAAQAGPVFSVDEDGCLHLRYTARTRSIEWRDDPQTEGAVQALRRLLERSPWIRRVRLEAGMGMIGHNVLHDRSAFEDDPARPRLLLRARFLDRVELPAEAAWRNG